MKPGRSWQQRVPVGVALIAAVLVMVAAVVLPLRLAWHTTPPVPRPAPRHAVAAIAADPVLPAPKPVPSPRPSPPKRHTRPAPAPSPSVIQTARPAPVATPSPAPAPSPTPTSVPVPAGTAQAYAYGQLSHYGWPASEFACLLPLWERESGWSNTAREPTTGAYGVPQANGHGQDGAPYPAAYEAANPPAYGGSSDADVQVDWGLRYIADVYGTPCRAWYTDHTQGTY